MRLLTVIGLAVLALLPYSASAAPLDAPSGCQYVLGFKALHDALPDIAGECTTNEYHNPQNGDGLQQTTRGLLVWRKADNHTAFTDGHQTWVLGPYGIQRRLNTERFHWEQEARVGEPTDPDALPHDSWDSTRHGDDQHIDHSSSQADPHPGTPAGDHGWSDQPQPQQLEAHHAAGHGMR